MGFLSAPKTEFGFASLAADCSQSDPPIGKAPVVTISLCGEGDGKKTLTMVQRGGGGGGSRKGH